MASIVTWKITYISTRKKSKGKKRKKQTSILHTQATYCTHKQQLHQLRNVVSQPQWLLQVVMYRLYWVETPLKSPIREVTSAVSGFQGRPLIWPLCAFPGPNTPIFGRAHDTRMGAKAQLSCKGFPLLMCRWRKGFGGGILWRGLGGCGVSGEHLVMAE